MNELMWMKMFRHAAEAFLDGRDGPAVFAGKIDEIRDEIEAASSRPGAHDKLRQMTLTLAEQAERIGRIA